MTDTLNLKLKLAKLRLAYLPIGLPLSNEKPRKKNKMPDTDENIKQRYKQYKRRKYYNDIVRYKNKRKQADKIFPSYTK